MPHRNASDARAYHAAYHAKNREHRRGVRKAYDLRRRTAAYGTTPEDVRAAIEAQCGLCAICKQPPIGGSCRMESVLHVDHDHETGRFRAMLCSGCNLAIGRLLDDAGLCRAAAEYLERHGAKPKPRKPARSITEEGKGLFDG